MRDKRNVLRRKLSLLVLTSLFLIALVGGLVFIDDAQAEFNLGTHNNTLYNSTGGYLQLNLTTSNGTFVSQVFNGSPNATWDSISWVENTTTDLSTLSYMVLRYKLDESSGAIIDTSPKLFDGTYNGTLYSQPAKYGTGIGFDGINDMIEVNNDSSLNFGNTDPFTIGAWINLTNNGKNQIIVSKRGYNGTKADRGWVFYITPANEIEILFQGDISTSRIRVATNDSNLTTNNLYYLTMTYTGSNDASGVKLYVDNVDISQTIIQNTLSGTIKNTNELWLGDQERTPLSFDGIMDEVIIWNKTLTIDEISEAFLRNATNSLLNLSVRSCDDPVCSGDDWVDITDISPQTLSIDADPYFQYNVSLVTEDFTSTPKLYNVTINYTTFIAGKNPPQITINNIPSSPSIYLKDGNYNFTSYIIDLENSISNVIMQHNFTGFNINISPTNDTLNIFYYEYSDLAVGDYNVTWYANDTDGNQNNRTNIFKINKATPNGSLKLNNYESDINLLQSETVVINGSFSQNEIIGNLTRNGTTIAVGNPAEFTNSSLIDGNYNYTYFFEGSDNYTSYSKTYILNVINKSVLDMSVNGLTDTTLKFYEQQDFIVQAQVITGLPYNASLYRNGVLIETGTNIISNQTLGAGTYTFTWVYESNNDFSATTISQEVRIIENNTFAGMVIWAIFAVLIFFGFIGFALTFLVEGGLEYMFFLFGFFMLDLLAFFSYTFSLEAGLPTTISNLLEVLYRMLLALTIFIVFWVMYKLTMLSLNILQDNRKRRNDTINDDLR